jgi:hypothetical protein
MHHSNPADHAQHDLDLIAGHAAGDLDDTDRTRAEALLQSCTSCADLRSDLVALASATRILPTVTTAPRDFRLTAAQAARLRRPGFLKSLLRPFAGPRSGARPMAMAFTSLGLAGMLVANILAGLLGSAALESRDAGAGAAIASAASGGGGDLRGPVAVPQQPGATDDRVAVQGAGQPSQEADKNNEYTTGQASSPPRAAAHVPGPSSESDQRLHAFERGQLVAEANPIFVVSLALLVVGLVLFGLRFAARRVR